MMLAGMNRIGYALNKGTMDTSTTSIDEYISRHPENLQALLTQMRTAIRAAAPEATEAIKYGMPTFVQQGNLVHFAACKNHIGFYPTPTAIVAFADALAAYTQSKGAVHLPLDKPLPIKLIARMVKFRVKENLAKAALRKK